MTGDDFLRQGFMDVEVTPQLDVRFAADLSMDSNDAWVTVNKVVRHPARREVQALGPRITDPAVLDALGDACRLAALELRRLQMCAEHGWDRQGNVRLPEPVPPGWPVGVVAGTRRTVADVLREFNERGGSLRYGQDGLVVEPAPLPAEDVAIGSNPPIGWASERFGPDPDRPGFMEGQTGYGGDGRDWAAWFHPEFGWSKWHITEPAALGGEDVVCSCALPVVYRKIMGVGARALQQQSKRGVCKNCLRWLSRHGGY